MSKNDDYKSKLIKLFAKLKAIVKSLAQNYQGQRIKTFPK